MGGSEEREMYKPEILFENVGHFSGNLIHT